MSNTTMLTMLEAKALANKSLAEAAGKQFTAQTGAIGVILPEPSVRGKPQAELTCLEEGCTETHVREISDWHQCGKCRTHKKSKSRGGGGGTSVTSGVRIMKVLDTDSDEVRVLKEENNRVVEQLQAAEKAERAERKAREAEERKAKQEEAKQLRALEQAEKQKQQLAANLEKIKEEAAKRGIPVSPKTLAKLEAAANE